MPFVEARGVFLHHAPRVQNARRIEVVRAKAPLSHRQCVAEHAVGVSVVTGLRHVLPGLEEGTDCVPGRAPRAGLGVPHGAGRDRTGDRDRRAEESATHGEGSARARLYCPPRDNDTSRTSVSL